MRDKIEFTPDYGTKENSSIIKVIGVGGGGGNAVKHMYSEGIVGVDFLVCNTDYQALAHNAVPSKLVLGESGLGAGANPDVARELAMASREQIVQFIGNETKMLFITAGMGKGTGTGAAPVIAQIAQEMGILTIGVVTFPFKFEGEVRAKHADTGINELKKYVDSLIVVKNQNIIKYYNDEDLDEAFGYADDVLKNAVKCIAELITVNAYQNIDFNDIQTVMKNSGPAMLGLAVASGENRIEKVVEEAPCPLLNEDVITNAKNFLFFISYGSDNKLKMSELELLTEKFDHLKNQNSDVIWGRAKDDSLGDAVKLSVIITNYNTEEKQPIINTIPVENVEPITIEAQKIAERVVDDFDNFLDTKNPVTENTPVESQKDAKRIFDFIDDKKDNTHKSMEVENNFNSRDRQISQNSYQRTYETVGANPITTTMGYQPQMVRNDHDPRYENNDFFGELINTPAILRKRQDNQNELQTMTINQQPNLEMEDDMHIFFKDIPD
ncbi:MAG: cell division protein FtsZ [Bacteroidales bacterium]